MKRPVSFNPLWVFFIVIFALPPLLDPYWVDVLNNVGLYAILGISLNLIVGHTGLFNLGHAAFYAIGAYTSAILNTKYHMPILSILPLSGFTAGLFAFMVMRPIIHLRGDYLCIVTIGVGEIVRIALVNNIFGITGGSNGIFGIARPELFGYVIRSPHQFFYLIWIFLIITVVVFKRLEHSRVGRAFNCIRDDEIAAQGCGINVASYKLTAFVIGATWAGMTGNIFATKMTIISPESFSFWESVIMFTIVILGGAGSIEGTIIGAFLIIGLPEIFRDLSSARMLVFGLAMVIMMILRPRGLIPPKLRSYNVRSILERDYSV
ncbi:MAG: branched-chain amino acid ABC transporter permease [Syntrophobacterales bacterium]|nr:branched-chain amino acid ABC transporter permease [Syntrophobacterales bacterium]